MLANILLYLPLGLAITAYFCARRMQVHRIFIVVLVICFTISYFCEVLQFFLPARFPSWRDVESNMMGGILVRSVCFAGRKFDELSLQLFGNSLHSSFRSGARSSQLFCYSFETDRPCLNPINNHATHSAGRHLIFITSCPAK
ncbi:MAG: VanZ family protein [Deltaproteobacteria bacterium]|nr:MAG: VanZ family protein [Deltaproteobacteria bacterium]